MTELSNYIKMWSHSSLSVQSRVDVEKRLEISKIRQMFQGPHQFATKTDLVINGFNLNQIINNTQYKIEDEEVSEMFNLPIYDELLEYIQEKYLHSLQQNIATLVMSNMYFVGKPAPPSHELTKKLIYLIQYGSAATIDNCIALITNAALDFPQWKQKMITEYGICQILCQSLQRMDLERQQFRYAHNYMVMQAMIVFIKDFNPNNAFKQYFQSLVLFLTFTPDKLEDGSQLVLSRAYTCLYWLMKIFPQDSAIFIITYHIYENMEVIMPFCHLYTIDITCIAVFVLELLLQNNKLYQDTFMPAYFIQKILKLIQKGNILVRLVAYPALVKAIEQQKILGLTVAKLEYIQNRLQMEKNQTILYCLVKIYSDAQSKVKDHSYTEKIKKMFEKVICRYPQNTKLINFILETIKRFHPL